MYRLRQVAFISFCALYVLVSHNVEAQNSPNYIVSTGKSTLTFVPRPDLGFVCHLSDIQTGIEAFNGMLSSSSDIEYRTIRGLNKRNLTVLLNAPTDDSKKNAFAVLQSQSVNGYKAPLFTVNDQPVAVIPEIVVRLAFEEALDDLQVICEKNDLTIKQKLEFTQKEYLLEVRGLDADSVFDKVEKLHNELFVEWAVPNIASQPIMQEFEEDTDASDEPNIPNDQFFSQLWHIHNTGQTGGTPHADINALNAWKITTGDPNIIVAVVDTGVDINHPDLVNNIAPGYDFFDDDNDPSPYLDEPIGAHGTMCAGLVAAQGNNDIGVCGVARNCKIMPIRIANGEDFIADSDIATAIRWAASHGADILSNSWGGDYPSQTIYSAILDVTKQNGIGRKGKGCIVCFAAGNWQDGGPVEYPAARPEVIAVGATDHDDKVWYYSASGPELDIVAPSGGTREDYFFKNKAFLWTTDITGIYGYSIYNLNSENIDMWDYSDTMSGTSGACPIVAGVAALVLSVDPNLTNLEVRRILLDTAVDLGEPGTDEYYGFGRVDANAAVNLALNPPTTPPSSGITLYVDDDAPDDPCSGNPDFSDPNEEGTPLHPFDSIQKAINFAIFSETIIVLPGTYTGQGNHDIDFLGKSVKVISESGPKNCIIDCQFLGNGFYLHNSESHEAQITGITIKNGIGFVGAGIYCDNGSSPVITNCTINNCLALQWNYNGGIGGGLSIASGCSPEITDCTFKNNRASLGGGAVYNEYGEPTFRDCSFFDNRSGNAGGGICNLDSPSIELTNCIFTGNTADYEGGALYCEDGIMTITNCTFASNISLYGNAITCDSYSWLGYGSSLSIKNCIIWDGLDSIDNYDFSSIYITYSDVQKSGSNAWQGTGNINKNPAFAYPDDDDYHLKSQAGRWDPVSKTWVLDFTTSPCIDTGDPASDYKDEPTPNGQRINMGFYGGTSQASKTFVITQP